MLKIVGICILLFTIYSISRRACEKEEGRLFLLSEMVRFVREVRLSLSVAMKPLGCICREFVTDEPLLSRLVGSEFASDDGRLLSDIEGAAGKDAARIFSEFITGFGRGYLKEEIARVDLTAEKLEGILNLERTSVPHRVRVCKTLGIASSFALVILFI